MGILKVLSDTYNQEGLERIIVYNYKGLNSKKKYRNLIDMHIQNNTTFIERSKDMYLSLPVFISKEAFKDNIDILYKEYEELFSYIDKHEEDYFLTMFDIGIIKSKSKTDKTLLRFILEKINKYPDNDLPLD